MSADMSEHFVSLDAEDPSGVAVLDPCLAPTAAAAAATAVDSSSGALDSLHRQTSALADKDDELSRNSFNNRSAAAADQNSRSENDSAIFATRPDVLPPTSGTSTADVAVSVTAASSAAATTTTLSAAEIAQQKYCAPNFTIYLNVYDLLLPGKDSAKGLSAEMLNIFGMGCHHSGVEILGQEYSFGSDESGRNDPTTEGVYSVYPRTACSNFKTQITLGNAPLGFSMDAFEALLVALRPRWRSATYHILNHNCNHFTTELIKAIDDLFPTEAPECVRLMPRYPTWVNRAANCSGAIVPSNLIRSITDAINPPTACAPDLVNFIDIPAFDGDYPPPLAPQCLPSTNRWAVPAGAPVTPTTVVECAEKPTVAVANGQQPQWDETNTATVQPNAASSAASSGGGGVVSSTAASLFYVGGFAKKLVQSVASTVRSAVISHVDDADRRDYTSSFGGVKADDLLSAYICTVIHVNRPQKAKVFIAIDGIRVKGAHNLHLHIPYDAIHRYYYGAVIRPHRADGNALPYFVPIEDPLKADCVLLILSIDNRGPGLRMIPLIDFNFLGGAGGLISNSRDIMQNAMAYLDFAYRANTE